MFGVFTVPKLVPAPADEGTGSEAPDEVASPPPKCRDGMMPEMMKSKASTAAIVLTVRTERLRVSSHVCRFCGIGLTILSWCTDRSGTGANLLGKTNERGTSSSGIARSKTIVSRKSDRLCWHCGQVDK